MAKGNPFLGNITGSFGDITLSSYRGKTVIRRKCAPKNPRTPKQIYQRMFFATISKSRTALKPIIDHSFEQVQHGIDSLNYFTKRNIALMREGTVYDYAKQTWVNPNMNFVAPKATSFPANPLRISEGSLSPIESIPAIGVIDTQGYKNPDSLDSNTAMPFFMNFSPVEGDASELIDNALKNEDVIPGDYMTAVLISCKIDDLGPDGDKAPFPCFLHWVRYKVCQRNPSDSSSIKDKMAIVPTNVDGLNFEVPTLLPADYSGAFAVVSLERESDGRELYFPYFDFSDVDIFKFAWDRGNVSSPFKPFLSKGEDRIIAATWIHSRPTDSKILTSTQDLTVVDFGEQGMSPNLDMETAFDLWTKQAKAIGEPKYLLEGGDV